MVRARDVADFEVTLVADDGAIHRIRPQEQEAPPLPGVPPPGDLYNPRLFVEDVLALGFDDFWLRTIVDWALRHRLLLYPGKTP